MWTIAFFIKFMASIPLKFVHQFWAEQLSIKIHRHRRKDPVIQIKVLHELYEFVSSRAIRALFKWELNHYLDLTGKHQRQFGTRRESSYMTYINIVNFTMFTFANRSHYISRVWWGIFTWMTQSMLPYKAELFNWELCTVYTDTVYTVHPWVYQAFECRTTVISDFFWVELIHIWRIAMTGGIQVL